MSPSVQRPKCKFCQNEMYMTRFQSNVTDTGIDREQAYECLWCGETDKVFSHTSHSKRDELAA
jgi:hypothetical protein